MGRVRAGTRPAPTGIQRFRDASQIWGGRGQAQGRHLQKFDGNGGRGLAKPFRLGTCWNIDTRSTRHVVGEGALRGRSPRTREGRIGPTAQKTSGQWSVVRDAGRSRRTLTPNRFYITFTHTCQQGLAGYRPRQSQYRRLVSEREER